MKPLIVKRTVVVKNQKTVSRWKMTSGEAACMRSLNRDA
jgi:hypothetical protein